MVKIKLKDKNKQKICAIVVVPGGADHFHNKRSGVHTHPLKYVDILNFGLGLVNSLCRNRKQLLSPNRKDED